MNVALIPARGGSKSIPKKNIKILNGKPLIYWTIKAAVECKYIDCVYVASEDEQIRRVVEEFQFGKVRTIDRSMESASDTAATEIVMLEFAQNYDFDNIVLIQAISPLLVADDLNRGFEKMCNPNVDSVLSVVEQKRFVWEKKADGFVKAINYDVRCRPRRQDFDAALIENGAFYITKKERLLQSQSRISGNISAVKMSEKTYWEIDEPSDFETVEILMRKKMNENGEVQTKREFKLFLTDCDGCLTDGGMFFTNSGDEFKKFNAKDGQGFQLLKEAGIKTGIITGEYGELIRSRADKLKVDYVKMGVKNKRLAIEDICKELEIGLKQVIYIGDDINDLETMKVVGYSCSVSDAIMQIKSIANYISPRVGGDGAVRDCIDYLFDQHIL